MTWKLVSDSSSDLVTGQLTSTAADFEAVPLCLRVGEREFWDTAELDIPALLAAMVAEKGPCTTACPSPEAFAEVDLTAKTNEVTKAFLGSELAQEIFACPGSFGGYQKIDTETFFG